MVITSTENDRIKEIKKLIKSARERRKSRLYVVEGIRMVREIPDSLIESMYVSENFFERYGGALSQLSMEPIVISDKVFRSFSDTETPQGILALVRMYEWTLADILKADETPMLFIVERLQDPGNLGTIIRTAEGAGATGIILSSDSVDVYNPKTVRATMGSIFRVPIFVSENLVFDMGKVKERGITVYGAHLDGTCLYEKSFLEGVAFLIGNEGNGLSEDVSATADQLIKIPMKGRLESLNAATSVAVIAYEALRQRIQNI